MQSPEFKDKYIKLETRLLSFIDSLIENFTEEKLGGLASYLRFLISDNVYLPHKFLSLFELSRIDIYKGQISDYNNNQKKMILCFYIICKILIKSILLDQDVTKNKILNLNVKK